MITFSMCAKLDGWGKQGLPSRMDATKRRF